MTTRSYIALLLTAADRCKNGWKRQGLQIIGSFSIIGEYTTRSVGCIISEPLAIKKCFYFCAVIENEIRHAVSQAGSNLHALCVFWRCPYVLMCVG